MTDHKKKKKQKKQASKQTNKSIEAEGGWREMTMFLLNVRNVQLCRYITGEYS